jgi:hypothetical protein
MANLLENSVAIFPNASVKISMIITNVLLCYGGFHMTAISKLSVFLPNELGTFDMFAKVHLSPFAIRHVGTTTLSEENDNYKCKRNRKKSLFCIY